jgi:hypothetical protein
VTTFPETVQTPVVVEAKATARSEVDVASRAKGAVPKLTVPGAPKVMVCAAWLTMKLRVTGGAAE